MEKRITGGRKEGREEGIGIGQMLQLVRRGNSVRDETVRDSLQRESVHTMDKGRVRGERGPKGEDIDEKRKARGLIDDSSMHSACLFVIF